MKKTYAIIGGGISGLVAAYRLRAIAGADASIMVFDPADRLGGTLRTEQLAGQPIDIGAESFVVRRPEVPALLGDLGIAGYQISPVGLRPTIYSQGRHHRLPVNTVIGIPASSSTVHGLVDDATEAQIAFEPQRLWQWSRGDDPAVGAIVADRFGEQVVTRSVDPMVSGVYAGSAAMIGIRSAAPAVAHALDAGACSLTDAVRRALPTGASGPVFGAIDGGYRVLIDHLVHRSAVSWVHTRVLGMTRHGTGWVLDDVDGDQWHADGVIVAVPAPQLAALIGDYAPRAAAAASKIPVASAVILAMALPSGTPFPAQSGVVVASGEDVHTKAITLSSRKWGSAATTDMVRLSFGRYGDTTACTVSDADFQRWACSDIHALFGITVEPVDMIVHRWHDALPQYGPGHGRLVREIRADLPDTVAVAGNYLDGIGVAACVGTAERAARAVAHATTRC